MAESVNGCVDAPARSSAAWANEMMVGLRKCGFQSIIDSKDAAPAFGET
jgi:hypothetical protein